MTLGQDPFPEGYTKCQHGHPVTFETLTKNFKSLNVIVTKAEDLRSPSSRSDWSPVCKVVLGENSLLSQPALGGGSNCQINSKFDFPFIGEPAVRVEVRDVKSRMVGFHDFNITSLTPAVPEQSVSTHIQGPAGPSGRLTFKVKLNNDIVRQPKVVAIDEREAGIKVTAQGAPPAVRVVFLEARGMHDIQTVSKMDPYIKATVGTTELKSQHFTSAGKDCDFNTIFNFPYNGEEELDLVVMDKENLRTDRPVATAKIPLKAVIDEARKIGSVVRVVKMASPKKGEDGGTMKVDISFLKNDVTPSVEKMSAVAAKITRSDSASSHGLTKTSYASDYKSVKVYLFSGKGLYDPQLMGKMDPYVKVRVGTDEVTGEVMRDAGKNPNFYAVYTFPYTRQQRIRLLAYDREHMIKDRQIGVAKINLDDGLERGLPSFDSLVSMVPPKGKDGGVIKTRVIFSKDTCKTAGVETFDPSTIDVFSPTDFEDDDFSDKKTDYIPGVNVYKSFRVDLIDGRDLYDPQITGKMDPYCKLHLGSHDVKTEVMRDAGINPDFMTSFIFPYNNEKEMNILLKDREHMMKNREIGTGKVDIQELLLKANEKQEKRIDITGPKGKKGGNLLMHFTFSKKPVSEPSVDIIDVLDTQSAKDDLSHIQHSYKSLRVHVFKANDLYDPEFVGKMDPYIKLTMDNGSELQGKTFKKAGTNVDFHETFIFPYKAERYLTFKVYDYEYAKKNRCVGTKMVDLTNPLLTPSGLADRRIALAGPNEKDGGTLMYRMEFSNEECPIPKFTELMATVPDRDWDIQSEDMPGDGQLLPEVGIYKTVKVSVFEGRDLYDPQWVGKMDPYCKVRLGDHELVSEVQRDAGKNCEFDTAFYFPYKGHRVLSMELRDREHVGKNRLIGTVQTDMEKLMKEGAGPHKVKLELTNKKGPAGHVNVHVLFVESEIAEPSAEFVSRKVSDVSDASSHGLGKIPTACKAKSLRVTVINAEELYDPQWVGKMDPYVRLILGNIEGKSEVMRDAGKNAIINTCFHFPYEGQKHLKLQVWDRERLKRNREVGSIKLDLSPFAKQEKTVFEHRCALDGPKGKSGGYLQLKLELLDQSVPHLEVFKTTTAALASGDVTAVAKDGYVSSTFKTVRVILKDGKDLYSPSVTKMDPFTIATLGTHELQTKVCKNQGKNPKFDTVFFFPWSDLNRYMKFNIKDYEFTRKAQGVGTVDLDLGPYSGSAGPHDISLPVESAKAGTQGGNINLELTFLPLICGKATVGDLKDMLAIQTAALGDHDKDGASSEGKTRVDQAPPELTSLNVTVLKSNGLYDPEVLGKMDPFVNIRLGNTWLKTEVMKGRDATFNTVFLFPYNRERRVKIDVQDKQMRGSRPVGDAKVDLVPFLLAHKTGQQPVSVSLRNPKGVQEGTLDLIVEFTTRQITQASQLKLV